MKRVTGIGGVFLKSDDHKKQAEWYQKHLGIKMEEWGGSIFRWKHFENPEKNGSTSWSIFKKDSPYMQPGNKDFMINYRVENLETLLQALKEEGIEQVGNMETHDYGKFAWIMDPEGNKIELWEPKDDAF